MLENRNAALMLIAFLVSLSCNTTGSGGEKDDDDDDDDPATSGDDDIDSDDDDDDSTTPVDPPGPEYCSELTGEQLLECCLTHAAFYPEPLGGEREDEYVWSGGVMFNESTPDEWNWIPDSFKNECPPGTCIYGYMFYFVMRPTDDPWPSSPFNFGREYTMYCEEKDGDLTYDERIMTQLEYDVQSTYSYTALGDGRFRLEGLDLFPFVDDEVYEVELEACNVYGGSTMKMTLSGAPIRMPLYVWASNPGVLGLEPDRSACQP